MGEPAVSQYNHATLVQWSDIKCQILGFPSRKKQSCKSSACEMTELEVPSMSWSLVGGIPLEDAEYE